MNEPSSVRFCRLTPEGRGAIATIWVAGRGASALLDHCFQPNSRHRRLTNAQVGDLLYGVWHSSTMADISPPTTPDSAEDLVITVPQREQFEIHCHGGQISYQLIARDLICLGASEISAENFIRRNAANFWMAELEQALLQAETELAALTIAAQFQIWPEALRRWLALVSHDDGPTLLEELKRLQDLARTSRHLLEPWKVLLQGAPNVGKSSLVNAMVGYERAVVDPTPGTTRDVVSQRTVIAGWPVELFDTAGIREGAEPLESEAIERGKTEALHVDCLIHVFDLSGPPALRSFQASMQRAPDIVVMNKSDLHGIEPVVPGQISVSAKLGVNIDGLLQRISEFLIPGPLPAQSPLLVTPGMEKQVQRVVDALENSDGMAAETALRREANDR